MKTKNKIGVLIVLGGVGLMGYYWMKKNKPTTSQSQAKGLQALSNFYKTGGDESFIAGYRPPLASSSGISFVSASDSKAISMAINCGGDGMLGRLAGIDCTEYCAKYPKDCTGSTTSSVGSSIGTNNGGIKIDWTGTIFANLGLPQSNLSNVKTK